MATTELGTRLTERHRLDQIKLRTLTVRNLVQLWPAFDIADIAASWARLEPAIVALIQARRPLSGSLAAEYLEAFRLAEQVAGSARVVPSVALTADDLIPNLRLLGPRTADALVAAGRADATRIAFTNVAGEMTRQILGGGRQTLVETANNDRRARGYFRVTDGAPCAFCALLAGRGPVYRSEESSGFSAHRKCGCTGEILYFTDAPWPPSAAKWDDLYSEASKAVPRSTPDWSAEVRREFRRRYEAA